VTVVTVVVIVCVALVGRLVGFAVFSTVVGNVLVHVRFFWVELETGFTVVDWMELEVGFTVVDFLVQVLFFLVDEVVCFVVVVRVMVVVIVRSVVVVRFLVEVVDGCLLVVGHSPGRRKAYNFPST
jgi:hypothetical protein